MHVLTDRYSKLCLKAAYIDEILQSYNQVIWPTPLRAACFKTILRHFLPVQIFYPAFFEYDICLRGLSKHLSLRSFLSMMMS